MTAVLGTDCSEAGIDARGQRGGLYNNLVRGGGGLDLGDGAEMVRNAQMQMILKVVLLKGGWGKGRCQRWLQQQLLMPRACTFYRKPYGVCDLQGPETHLQKLFLELSFSLQRALLSFVGQKMNRLRA